MNKVIMYMVCLLFAGFALQSCGQSDSQLKNEVDRALRDRYSTVGTAVNSGVVTLTGALNTEAERAAAESVVRSVSNVKSVVNNITVSQPTPTAPTVSPDMTLRDNIANRLNTAGYNNVIVTVNNGAVVLSGEVKRSDLQNVMRVVNEFNPTSVTNNITLR